MRSAHPLDMLVQRNCWNKKRDLMFWRSNWRRSVVVQTAAVTWNLETWIGRHLLESYKNTMPRNLL